MAAKLWFATAGLGFFALASGAFLGAVPTNTVVVEAPALGGILRSLAAMDSDNLHDKDLEEMEGAIEDLVTKSDDAPTKIAVKQLTDLIVNRMIPSRERQQAADQAALDERFHALEVCHLDERVKRDMTVHSRLQTAEVHKEDYEDSLVKNGMCLEILDGKALVKQAYCASVADATELCHCDEKVFALLGSRNGECNNAPKIAASDRKCCDAYYAHAKQNAECAQLQNDAQYAEKQHGIIMDKVCDTYNTCYDTKLAAYRTQEEWAKKSEARRNWAILHRIQCLVGEFKDGKVSKEQAQACKVNKHEGKGIQYPTVPPKEACSSDVMS